MSLLFFRPSEIAADCSTLLLFVSFGVVLSPPSAAMQVLSATHEELEPTSSLTISRIVSCMMLVVYGCYLFFQLLTHTHLFEGEDETDGDDDEERILGAWGAVFWLAVRLAPTYPTSAVIT